MTAFNIAKIIDESKIGGSRIPTETVLRVIYKNNISPLRAKEFHIDIELLY